MVRYIITAVAGAVVGAGILIVLFLIANPIPSSLTCSVNDDRTVVDCVDQNGKPIKAPHTVKIR